MPKHVVISHTEEEDVYRLVYAIAEDHVEAYLEENPDYDPQRFEPNPDFEPVHEVPNPDYDPEQELSEDNWPHILVGTPPTPDHQPMMLVGKPSGADNPSHFEKQRTVTIVHSHKDIVWSKDDEQWQGKSPEEIAAMQRKIIKDMITKQVADAERASAKAAVKVHSLGGEGTEL